MPALHEAAAGLGVPFGGLFEPVQKELKTAELTLRYLEWGSPDSPTVLLLHGFAQTAHSWDFVALSLADRYHVVSLDARGHGDSDWASDAAYSVADHRRDVNAVARHLGPSALTIVGLSMGGGTAYSYAAEQPGDVRALVIVDTGPGGEQAGRRRISDFVTLPDELDTLEEFVERVHAYLPQRPIEQVRATLVYNVRQNDAGKWTWKYDRALRDPGRPRTGITTGEAWSYLKSVSCPALLVRGANSDILGAGTAAEMAAVMQDCTLATVDNAGHLVPGDNPAGFIMAVGPWLDQLHRF